MHSVILSPSPPFVIPSPSPFLVIPSPYLPCHPEPFALPCHPERSEGSALTASRRSDRSGQAPRRICSHSFETLRQLRTGSARDLLSPLRVTRPLGTGSAKDLLSRFQHFRSRSLVASLAPSP